MKTFILVAALVSLPFGAHAGPMGILPMASPRNQLKELAQAQGFLKKGSGQRLYVKTVVKPTIGNPGKLSATIKGLGGITGRMKNALLATGVFKIEQTSEGEVVEPSKFNPILSLSGR